MFAVLFLLRIPAGFTMAIVGFLGLAYATSFTAAFGMIGAEMWNIFSGYGLTVIPMFILVGEFVHYAGYNDSLYHATNRWFGHYRGGLAITTIMACAAFSAISGSNTATAATMSTVAIPAMKKYRYHPILNAGSVAAGATLGVLIPPSIVLVVYGIYTGQSIGKLFFGNVIPSAIATVLIAATVFVICRRHPDWGPAAEKSTWKERFQALPEALDIIVLFAIIMYALFTGVVTATEAAALSCTLGLVICLARRKLSWKGFLSAVGDTVRISCMVFMIIAGAVIFGRFLAITRLPFEAAGWIGSLAMPKEMLLGADPAVLHRRRLHHGRARISADLAADLLPARRGLRLRPDLVRPGDHDRHDDGRDHAPDRDLLLCRGGDGEGYPAGHRFPGGLVLHPGLHPDAHHPCAVPLRDGADPVEPRPLKPAVA